MSQALKHRGPEDEGTWLDHLGDCEVALLHRRLRILDLSTAGRQPMTRDNYAIIFNGEIYNYLELRRQLEEDGHYFSSTSDTEVILMAYTRWGAGCVQRLHGMFAFALWDGDKRELLLARDRVGKKPLFYKYDGQSFAFGSEIKAVLAAIDRTPGIDPEALHDYLTYLYVPYPKTMFQGIQQLPPGSWMRIKICDRGLDMQTGRYWDPMSSSVSLGAISQKLFLSSSRSPSDLQSYLQELIAESVRSRLISDVPLGVLLSGGIDSSIITAMMARSSTESVRAFSIGFSQAKTYDEIPFAKLTSERFSCQHDVLQAEPSCARHLAKIIWHFDQPFGNPTAVLTYILSTLTKQFVTVALGGDGGDELFGGYPRYAGAYLSNVPRALPGFLRNYMFRRIGNAISEDCGGRHQPRRLREFLEGCGLPLIEMYLRWIGYFSPEEKAALYTSEFARRVAHHDSGQFLRGLYAESEGLEPLNRLAFVDIKSFLCCNVLEYADRMSMAHALELRAPFTDHRLVEFCLRLPFGLKVRYGESKWILKRAMKPFLPPAVLAKRKLGFNPPVGTWLKGELRNLPEALLAEKGLQRRGLFCPGAVQAMRDSHASGKRDYSLHIWALMMLEIWFRIYADCRSVESVQGDIDEAVHPINESCDLLSYTQA